MKEKGCVIDGLEEIAKMSEEVLTAAEVAEVLKISPSRVRYLLRAGVIRGIDVNPGGKYHKWRVPRQSLNEYLTVKSAS